MHRERRHAIRDASGDGLVPKKGSLRPRELKARALLPWRDAVPKPLGFGARLRRRYRPPRWSLGTHEHVPRLQLGRLRCSDLVEFVTVTSESYPGLQARTTSRNRWSGWRDTLATPYLAKRRRGDEGLRRKCEDAPARHLKAPSASVPARRRTNSSLEDKDNLEKLAGLCGLGQPCLGRHSVSVRWRHAGRP